MGKATFFVDLVLWEYRPLLDSDSYEEMGGHEQDNPCHHQIPGEDVIRTRGTETDRGNAENEDQ